MYANQDPILASSSGIMLKNSNSRTGSPINYSNLSSATPPGVDNEIVLPPGTVIDGRTMMTKYEYESFWRELV